MRPLPEEFTQPPGTSSLGGGEGHRDYFRRSLNAPRYACDVLRIKSALVLLAEVVEAGSITAAATALNYTPSAVSQQLRQFEIEVGQPLLQRQPRGVTATEAGAVLARHDRRVERQIGAAEADLAEIVGLRRGHLTIGTFPTIGSSLLPQAIIAFRALHPGIELSVRSAWFDPLTEMLDNGTLGLSLLWDYDWNRISPDRYD